MENNQEAAKVNETLEEMWNKPIQFNPTTFVPSASPHFKFNVRDEVYAKHYKKNGVITHREYHDNGRHQWDQYVMRVIHEDGRSEAYEIEASWLEMGHMAVID